MDSKANGDLATSFTKEVLKVVRHWAASGESVLSGDSDCMWSSLGAEYLDLQKKIADSSIQKTLANLIADIASGTAFSVLALIDGDRDFPRCDLVTSETGEKFGGGSLHERFSDVEISES